MEKEGAKKKGRRESAIVDEVEKKMYGRGGLMALGRGDLLTLLLQSTAMCASRIIRRGWGNNDVAKNFVRGPRCTCQGSEQPCDPSPQLGERLIIWTTFQTTHILHPTEQLYLIWLFFI